jgi:hypothetical protein
VTDGNVPPQLAERVLVKYLGYQAHVGEKLNLFAIGGGDAGTFLTAVLESE